MIRKKQLLKRIEALEKELEKDFKNHKVYGFPSGVLGITNYTKVPTVKGKIDALLEYLGLEIPGIDTSNEYKLKVKKVSNGKTTKK